MQCREACDLLDSFLGQELLVETNHQLMRHLEGCPDCRAELDARRQLRVALQRAFSSAETLRPRPGFADQMLSRVRETGTRRAKWSSLWTWGALAASALLVTATGLLLFGNRVPPVVRDAVGDHRYCAVQFRLAERPISLTDAAARYDPVYAKLQDTPPTDVPTAVGPIHVLERHSCVYKGRRFGHIVLRFDGQLVSLLVTAKDGGLGNAHPDSSAVSWLPIVDGQRVASFNAPGHVVFVVSGVQDRQFRQVSQALANSLSDRLAMAWRSISVGLGD